MYLTQCVFRAVSRYRIMLMLCCGICCFWAQTQAQENNFNYPCPRDTVVLAQLGQCDAVVDGISYLGDDGVLLCFIDFYQINGDDASGETFSIGVHEVGYVNMEMRYCLSHVTVLPHFPTLSNQTRQIAAGETFYTVMGGEFDPLIDQTCNLSGFSYKIIFNGAPLTTLAGTTLLVGAHHIEYFFYFNGVLADIKSFEVTIKASSYCPPDTVVYLPEGQCTTTIDGLALLIDEDAPAIITYEVDGYIKDGDDASNELFNLGRHEVTYLFFTLYTPTQTCSFHVTVLPHITVPTNQTRYIAPGETFYTAQGGEFDPLIDQACGLAGLSYKISLDGSLLTTLAGTTLSVGTHQVEWFFYADGVFAGAKSFEVTIRVSSSNCPPDTVVSAPSGQCDAVVNGISFLAGGGVTVENYLMDGIPKNGYDASGETFSVGVHTVEYIFMDGGRRYCTFQVTVLPAIPEDQTRLIGAGEISYQVAGNEFDPDCDLSVSGLEYRNSFNGASTLGGAALPVGTTTIEWTCLVDHQVVKRLSFTVTIEALECPDDIIVSVDAGQCYTTVNHPALSWTDGQYEFTGATTNPVDGNRFNAGTTSAVVWFGTDISHSIGCSFLIHVIPEIENIENRTVQINVPATSVFRVPGNGLDPTFTCAIPSGFRYENNFNGLSTLTGAEFPTGTTHVIWSFYVGNVLVATKSCVINVQNYPCPASVITSVVGSECDAVVNGISLAADAGIISYGGYEFAGATLFNSTDADASGKRFNIGVTFVTYYYDFSLGTESCTFLVTVVPEITIPGDQSKNNTPGQCFYKVIGSEFDPQISKCGNLSSFNYKNDINGLASLADADLKVGTTHVTWTFYFGNDVIDTKSYDVTITDNEAPVIISVPGSLDLVAECYDQDLINTWLSSRPEASDNCTPVNKLKMFVQTAQIFDPDCPKSYVMERKWIFEDAYGNRSNEFVQTITVKDTQPPVIITPIGALDTLLSCDDQIGMAVALALSPEVTDNCTSVADLRVTYSKDSINQGCPSSYTIIRKWKFTDECGNESNEFVQNIVVVDTVAPIITTIAGILDTLLSCDDQAGLFHAMALQPTAVDNCSAADLLQLELVVRDSVPGACPSSYEIIRQWRFKDECGNESALFQQTIIVVDTVAPVIVTLAESLDRLVGCDDQVEMTNALALKPTATDNCSAATNLQLMLVSVDTIYHGCPSSYEIIRQWRFKDECDNESALFQQTITVVDTVAPVIVTSAGSLDKLLGCDDQMGINDALLLAPVATDNCSAAEDLQLILVSRDSIAGACPFSYKIIRQWRFKDECGNESDLYTQTIVVKDTVAPTVLCKNDTVYLDEHGRAVLFAQSINDNSIDNCDDVNHLTYTIRRTGNTDLPTSSLLFACDDVGLVSVTLFVADACGNIDSCHTHVIVKDTIAPKAVCRSTQIEIELGANGTVSITPDMIDGGSWDNCTLPLNALSLDSTEFNCSHVGKLNPVTLTVTDWSGNKDSCVAYVVVKYHGEQIPAPAVSPVLQELCSGGETELVLSNPNYTDVTDWIWNITLPTHISSAQTNGSLSANDTIVQQLFNSSDSAKIVVFTITPKIYHRCVLDDISTTVWVNPQPRLVMFRDTSICDETQTNLPVRTTSTRSPRARVYYEWEIVSSNANVTSDETSSGREYIVNNSSYLRNRLDNLSASAQSVEYALRPSIHFTNRTEVCLSPHTMTYTVIVEPTPFISVVASADTICNATPIIFAIDSLNHPNGRWKFVLERGNIPANDSIPSVVIPHQQNSQFGQTIYNNSVLAHKVDYKFTPQIVTQQNGLCKGADTLITIRVNPTPVMKVSIGQDSICYDAGTSFTMTSNNQYYIGQMKYDLKNVVSNHVENVAVVGMYDFENLCGTEFSQALLKNTSDVVQMVKYSFVPVIQTNSLQCEGQTLDTTIYIAPAVKFDLVAKSYVGGYNISCNGFADGKIYVKDPIGGWQGKGYNYTWNVTGSTDTIVGLSANEYWVIVKDKIHGCGLSDTMILMQPAVLTATATVDPPNCNGPTGSITMNVSGGTANYYFKWEGPDYALEGYDVYKAEGLRSGRYFIDVIDANKCVLPQKEVRVDHYLGDNFQYNLNIPKYGPENQYNITCNGAQDGWITPILTIAASSYTWYYDGAIYKTDTAELGHSFSTADMAISHLDAGNYLLAITDSRGCLYQTRTQILNQPPPIQYAYIIPKYANDYEVKCLDTQTGRINISNVTGAYGGIYEYRWATTVNHSGLVDGSPSQQTLKAGEYSLTIRNSYDANGHCDTTRIFTLTEPSKLTIQATIPEYNSGAYQIACYGATSTIDVNVSGEGAPYTYQWKTDDGSGVNPTVKNQTTLTAGEYKLIVSYFGGLCADTATYILSQPNEIQDNADVSSIQCNGDENASIQLYPTGGAPGGYTYSWQPNAYITNIHAQNQSDLGVGTYVVTIVDVNSCTKTQTYVLEEPTAIQANLTSEDVSCTPGNDGYVAVAPTGGAPGYTYLWNTLNTTERIDGLAIDTYSVTITDANGCTLQAQGIVGTPKPLIVQTVVASSFNGYSIDCFDNNTGKINVDVQQGRPPYTYQWSSGETTAGINNLRAGTYQVLVTDNFNCTGNAQVTLTQPAKMRLQASTTDIICPDGDNGSIQLLVGGGVMPYQYNWSPGGTGTANREHLKAGSYAVAVTDKNHCAIDTVIVLVQPSPMQILFDVNAPFCSEINDGEIRSYISGGTPPYTYLWPNLGSTSQNIADVKSGDYTLVVTDALNCTISKTVTVGYVKDECLRIPNAFSPNGDGVNDRWEIMVGPPNSAMLYYLRDMYPEAVVEVYSANWGILLYRSQKGYPEPWDGKYMGKYLPVNSYFYIIRLDSHTKPITGNVTIIR